MSEPKSIFLPAFGKIVELRNLDSFVWATLRGWGALSGIKELTQAVQLPPQAGDPESQAKDLEQRLKQEEEDLTLIEFTDDEAEKDYPYLFALVSVRLWAMAEAAARDVVVEALKLPSGPPECSKLQRLKGPIAPFMGADADSQADLLADALWQSPEGRFRGVERFDAVLKLIGLGGSAPATIRAILLELSEIRHCVVHRGNLIDRRLLEA